MLDGFLDEGIDPATTPGGVHVFNAHNVRQYHTSAVYREKEKVGTGLKQKLNAEKLQKPLDYNMSREIVIYR